MTALDVAVDATIARLKALDDAERLQRVRWQAYADMSAEGKSHREISVALVEALTDRGLSQEEIRMAGVSHDSITVALSRLRG